MSAEAAGTLYEGPVMHARLKPFAHRFSYRVFSTLIDIDQLDALGRMSWLLSVNRFNILSIHESDHIDPRVSPPGRRSEQHSGTCARGSRLARERCGRAGPPS